MAKKGRIDTRTMLIILLIVVIIAAAYIVITNLPAEVEYRTPDQILNNKEYYLEQSEIIVRGFYLNDGGVEVIVSTLSTTQGKSALRIDSSNLEDALLTDTTLELTGHLIEDPDDITGMSVIFVVESFREV